ncbi:MAG TPA: ATP-binding protein, partial [Catalimonadaceae bacterium]|nr:ATP-binding protein [Catalimonadaceae bacterium]
MIKIAIVGPESTGKSELAKDLAAHFETTWVPEVARTFLHTLNRPYNREDVERIARLQVEEEEKKEKEANEILFCDTTL